MKRKLLSAAAMAALYPVVHVASVSAAISDIYDDESFNNYYMGLQGVVTSVLSTAATTNTFVVQDVTPGDTNASVLAYSIPKSTYTAVVGDQITFSAYDPGYQDAPELTASTGTTAFTLTSVVHGGTAPSPFLVTIPQALTAGSGYAFQSPSSTEEATYPYAEAIATVDNVYFNTSTASLSTTSNTAYYVNDHAGNGIELYDYKSDSAVLAAVTAANAANPGGYSTSQAYNITGYVDVYYGESEFYPTSITAVAAVPEPASLSLFGLVSVGLLGRRRRS